MKSLLKQSSKALILVGALSMTAANAAPNSPVVEFLKSDQGIRLLSDEFKVSQKVLPKDVSSRVVSQSNQSLVRQVTLNHKQLGRIRITIREPLKQKAPLPLVFMATGIQSGADAVGAFPESDKYVLANYEYPVSQTKKVVQFAAEATRSLPQIQGQMAVALTWMAYQDNILADRVNVVLVSFGSFVGPLALRLAKPILPMPVYSTVLAFGGADIKNLILPKLKDNLSSADYVQVVGPVSQTFDLLDPKHHLPSLEGPVLVINGDYDTLIPKESQTAMLQVVPKSTKVMSLQVGHIGIDHVEIIQQTLKVIEAWYSEIKALE